MCWHSIDTTEITDKIDKLKKKQQQERIETKSEEK